MTKNFARKKTHKKFNPNHFEIVLCCRVADMDPAGSEIKIKTNIFRSKYLPQIRVRKTVFLDF